MITADQIIDQVVSGHSAENVIEQLLQDATKKKSKSVKKALQTLELAISKSALNNPSVIQQMMLLKQVLSPFIEDISEAAKKPKAIWKKTDSEGHVYKYDFTGRKADQYKTGNFAWFKKTVANWTGSNKPELWIQVHVWDTEGKAAHDKYGKQFKPEELSRAKSYAKSLITDGKAKLTSIEARIRQPFGRYSNSAIVHQFGDFELAE